ncbi:MAG: hypothetical protein JO366_09180, partial [Methylobacteriaceae bacterium]|nr:hypothetical protein [Methylobacteriaceae bacterium]MBV9244971.1 hypothetical protein [Methylobacteriaceae bacterium]
MAHDVNDMARGSAAVKERVDPGNEDGAIDAGAIDEALQPLPGNLAIRRASHGIADRLLGPRKILVEKPP